MFLDMYLRYHDYLQDIALKKGITSWYMLLVENHGVLNWGMFLSVFVALISAVVYQTEYQQNSWKSLLSLPVSKNSVYLSKWMAVILFSYILIALNCLGLFAVGKLIGFPEPFDLDLYSRYVLYQYAGILGVASIHNWLSSRFKNILMPIAVGVAGLVGSSIIMYQFPGLIQWFPYLYPFAAAGLKGLDPSVSLYGGTISGVIFLILGMAEFRRRDIL
jgi:hypothetical protein